MPGKKRSKSSTQKSTSKDPNLGLSQPVALPFREAHANLAAAKAAKKGKAPPPTAVVPTIECPRRNVPEKTYSATAGPVLVNRSLPIVDPDIPLLPGQEDIPPSPKGVGHVTAPSSEVVPDSHAEAGGNLEPSVEPASHPFGQPGAQTNHNSGYGEDSLVFPRDTSTNGYFNGANWPSFAHSNQIGAFDMPNSYLPNPGNSFIPTSQSNLATQFEFAPSIDPVVYPSFLEQLAHTSNPEPGHAGAAASSSSVPQYRIALANLQTPTPVRTAPSIQPASDYLIPSYYPPNQPISQLPTHRLPSKTPSRKIIQANVANFISEQRKFRGRGKLAGAGPSTSKSQAINGPGPNIDYNYIKPTIRKAVFFELISVKPWPLHLGPLREATLAFVHSTPGGLVLAESASQDPKFDLTLCKVMSNVCRDAYTYTHSLIKSAYDVSPKSKTRLAVLLKDMNFLYSNEKKVSSKQTGLCCHEGVSRVVCALLFDTPAGLGTLYMDHLCAVDRLEPWHNELKDKSADAMRGVPIGLIVFAGTLICHVLECVRDHDPSAKMKKHKFEGTHYKKVWTKIQDWLHKYRYLGALRVALLQAVKARYNEINANSESSSDSSDSSSDSSVDGEDEDVGATDENAIDREMELD